MAVEQVNNIKVCLETLNMLIDIKEVVLTMCHSIKPHRESCGWGNADYEGYYWISDHFLQCYWVLKATECIKYSRKDYQLIADCHGGLRAFVTEKIKWDLWWQKCYDLTCWTGSNKLSWSTLQMIQWDMLEITTVHHLFSLKLAFMDHHTSAGNIHHPFYDHPTYPITW